MYRLIGINAVSFVFAIIANLGLLFNMANRLSFSIAQPITIVGWYLSSFILIGLVSAASYHLPLSPGEDRALTQAFYYAIMAAVLYFIISTLMIFTVYGAYRGHYDKAFKLTTSQRTLMLQTISFLVYLLGGAAVYHRIESWKFLDALYWADFTLFTIGIGADYAPKTHLGRGLLFPFAIGGILILGLVVGSIRSLVLERGKKKLGARMVEKKRQSVLKHMDTKTGRARLHPISKEHSLSSEGKSERDRRQAEFDLMRKIQDHAAQKRRWTSLCISAGAWLILWTIGAVVFWKAERNQEWSYFQSLYFSYTSLLTIGYGDFQPISNSGKAFFVFWSLLAVPTLTILISNMGDTVIKGIHDVTLYLGEFTVLPVEGNAKQRFQRAAAKLTKGKEIGGENVMEEPPGFLSHKADGDSEKQIDGGGGGAGDHLAEEYGNIELNEAKAARDRGDKLGEDIHLHQYLLVQELRNVMKHNKETPSRKYTYDEWAWFLKLIGEDEAKSHLHRPPSITTGKPSDTDDSRSDSQKTEKGDGQVRQWSWLGSRSPLMGELDEAEWVLERLSLQLEKMLKQQHSKQNSDSNDKPAESRSAKKTSEEDRIRKFKNTSLSSQEDPN